LQTYAANVLCVIGWSQILSAEALQTADTVIGAHASLLPEGKGSAPINWALIKGMTRTGNTLIRLSEGVDEGDILAQREFEISDEDTCATLYDKVAETNASMLVEVLGQIRDGTLRPTPQPKIDEPLWPRRRPEDGLIDWTQGSRQVYNFVRALTRPYPGAFSYINGRKVIVWHALQADVDTAPGLVTMDSGVFVGCGEGAVSIGDIEVEGIGNLQGEALMRFFENVKAFESNGE
jgi:methionyl-tRNA formyltransferase